jgi:hypothetical protein
VEESEVAIVIFQALKSKNGVAKHGIATGAFLLRVEITKMLGRN